MTMEKYLKKRTLDSFFSPASKKARPEEAQTEARVEEDSNSINKDAFSKHPTYPFPVPHLPLSISSNLSSLPCAVGKAINDQADLDLLYFQPYIPKYLDRQFFEFLRCQLPFYRVEYKIKRGSTETQIRTPRYTTVFGLDETSRFNEEGHIVNTASRSPVANDRNYVKYPPRPIPKCLDDLRLSTETATGCKFNFCLVNYYASGQDSISYHSDDERFLGPQPAIASFSLGAKRDFLMKHKPLDTSRGNGLAKDKDGGKQIQPSVETVPIKLPLGSGDMVLMRGATQANWLHSIPKRSGKNKDDGGRINITFRKALVRSGTENYYNYNVGMGPVYKWDERVQEMTLWRENSKTEPASLGEEENQPS